MKKKKFESAIYWSNPNFEKVTNSNIIKHCNLIISEEDITPSKTKSDLTDIVNFISNKENL